MGKFTLEDYNREISELFASHPSFQKVGSAAYKPGLERIELYSELHGSPWRKFKCVHVAGTNGKGTVCSMIAATLAQKGFKVGLYTSPHIYEFTERVKVYAGASACAGAGGSEASAAGAWAGGSEASAAGAWAGGSGASAAGFSQVPREWVYDYLLAHKEEFANFGFSFFEITTMMAFDYFAFCGVDYAVIEVGLGGRLDATNIITPAVSVITSIGLDHMAQLGSSLGEIAFEKAGIIKKGVPVVIGEGGPEINPVFERKVRYVNDLSVMGGFGGSGLGAGCSGSGFGGSIVAAQEMARLLHYAGSENVEGGAVERNRCTASCALKVLGFDGAVIPDYQELTGLSCRFQKVGTDPLVIKDLGHNAAALKYSFSELQRLHDEEGYNLVIVYGKAKDKDYSPILELMPSDATYIFTQADGPRATPASELAEGFTALHPSTQVYIVPDRFEAYRLAVSLSSEREAHRKSSLRSPHRKRSPRSCAAGGTFFSCAPLSPLPELTANRTAIYIGGSTYILDCDKSR